MKYDINLSAASSTLTQVNTSASGYQTAADAMGTAVQAAAQASQSGLVSGALQGYVEQAFSADVSAVAALTTTAVTQTNTALTYFSEGNTSMMATSVASLKHTDSSSGYGGQNRPLPV